MLKPGWLKRQIEKAIADYETWPEWMKRESDQDKFLPEPVNPTERDTHKPAEGGGK